MTMGPHLWLRFEAGGVQLIVECPYGIEEISKTMAR